MGHHDGTWGVRRAAVAEVGEQGNKRKSKYVTTNLKEHISASCWTRAAVSTLSQAVVWCGGLCEPSGPSAAGPVGLEVSSVPPREGHTRPMFLPPRLAVWFAECPAALLWGAVRSLPPKPLTVPGGPPGPPAGPTQKSVQMS